MHVLAIAVVAVCLSSCATQLHVTNPGGSDAQRASKTVQTWRSEPNTWPPAFHILQAACAPSLHCVALGSLREAGHGEVLYNVSYNSSTSSRIWPMRTVGGELAYVAGVSCPSARVCEAIGGNASRKSTAVRTTNGGVTWQLQKLPTSEKSVQQIDRVSLSVCVVIGFDNASGSEGDSANTLLTQDGGREWTEGGIFDSGYFHVPGNEVPIDLQCVSVRVCFDSTGAVQSPGELFGTQDAGRTWSRIYTAPSGSDVVGPEYCTTQSRCVALLQTESSNSSTSLSMPVWLAKASQWTSQTGPALRDRFISTVWCVPAGNACVVTGWVEATGQGRVEEIVKGESKWRVETVSKGLAGIGTDLACTSITNCVGISSIDDGNRQVVVTTSSPRPARDRWRLGVRERHEG